MQNNVDVDPQVVKPDSTVEIADLNAQPPAPTDLEIVRQRYQQNQPLCAELLSDCNRERRHISQVLAETKQRRQAKEEQLRQLERSRDMALQACTAAKIKLANIMQGLLETQTQLLEREGIYQPSVQMTDEGLQRVG
ncbi:uncharacterized protein isoform X2 [Choristoneura fumiferana]|uniref:uncharacterized protein isoform X2 n=1 Tax=Choristoneura fumiferana TaxID=7141 RepID=UPI003D158949